MSTTYLLLCFIPLGLGMAAIVFRNSSLGFLIGLVGSGWLFFSYNHIEDERVIPALESMTKDLPWESFTRRSAKFGERWGTHCVAFGGSLPNKIHVNIGRSEYYSRFDMERKYHSNHLSVKTSDVSTTSTSADELQAAVTECVEAIQAQALKVPQEAKERADEAHANAESFEKYQARKTVTPAPVQAPEKPMTREAVQRVFGDLRKP